MLRQAFHELTIPHYGRRALRSMWLERKTERETNLIGLSVIQ